MHALAPLYAPRRPTETPLYAIVRERLETFLRWTRDTYDKPLPAYVEEELRAYLRCGVFAHGFARAHCASCGHDLLVAFSCKGRAMCPSCSGRRMANTAAHLVDHVLPRVAVRQFVLSLPFEIRALAAFKADVLTALSRIFVDSISAVYTSRARRQGLAKAQCGAVTFVQRFGSSLNLNVHFHVVVLDGVYTREWDGAVTFHAATPPTEEELRAILERVEARAMASLRRRGLLAETALEDRSNEAPALDAMAACAQIAMARGALAQLRTDGEADEDDHATATQTRARALAVDRHGFNLHAAVHLRAEDDGGRERLCRYGARPPLSLARLRRLPGGRIAYRVKYAHRGRAKHRVMTELELLARLAALIPPPRYPLVRYHGVLAPKSSWRKDVVPKPPVDFERSCSTPKPATANARIERPAHIAMGKTTTPRAKISTPPSVLRAPRVESLAPNILSVRHWERLLGGTLYAATPRMDWATLLRRTFAIDVLACAKCGGRLRVLGAVTEAADARALLERLGISRDVPQLAPARGPPDPEDEGVASWGDG